MNLTSSEIATRFSGARPGLELIAVEEVGLPFFKLATEVVVQEPSPMAAIDEYVLRAVNAGFFLPEEVAGFLGISRTLADRAIANQCNLDHLQYLYDPGSGARVLKLTGLGQIALEKDMPVRERREIQVGFDRLLWSVTGRRLGDLILPKVAADTGLMEIPPKAQKRLKPADLTVDLVDRAIRELPGRSFREIEILALTNVGNRRMVLPAFALVYASSDGTSTQVAIAVDGRLSDEHERAFAEVNGPSRCGLVVDSAHPQLQRSRLPEPIASEVVPREQVQALQQRSAELNQLLEDTRTATAALQRQGIADSKVAGEAELRLDASEARQELASMPARALQTYEHDEYFSIALSQAKSRLVIMSVESSSEVLTENLIQRLERLCRQRVAVDLGWSASSDGSVISKKSGAMRMLEKLRNRYSTFKMFVSNETYPMLLWDDNLIITTFDWLSAGGVGRRKYRHEDGVLIRDAGYVESEYLKLRDRLSQDVCEPS